MKTIEYRFIDKTDWPRGEWDREPDKVQWPDMETGLPCLAVRNHRIGHWCGYVGVSAGHPYFGKAYDDAAVDIRCHGGLTYSSFCMEDDKQHGICHLVEPGEDDQTWWFGFDCGHADDVMPLLSATLEWGTYRNLAYIQKECTEIAAQLCRASSLA